MKYYDIEVYGNSGKCTLKRIVKNKLCAIKFAEEDYLAKYGTNPIKVIAKNVKKSDAHRQDYCLY